jgi:hypothetical protein
MGACINNDLIRVCVFMDIVAKMSTDLLDFGCFSHFILSPTVAEPMAIIGLLNCQSRCSNKVKDS